MNIREQILSAVSSHVSLSRQHLSQALALDIRTISRHVDTLVSQEYLQAQIHPLPKGRPVCEFGLNKGTKYYAGVLPTRSGLHGLVADSHGKLIHQISISEFSTEAEIPYTACKKIIYLLDRLVQRSGVKLHAGALLFSRSESSQPFASDLFHDLQLQVPFPLYTFAPIAIYAYEFRKHHPEIQNILCLHFGYVLELAYLNGDSLSSENNQLSLKFNTLRTGREILWHQVSLSTILDEVAETNGTVFYDYGHIQQMLRNQSDSVARIIADKEKIIWKSLKILSEDLHPDAVCLLALPGDLHLHAMKNLLNRKTITLSSRKKIPLFTECPESDSQDSKLLLAAQAAGYQAWERFLP